MTNLMKMLKLVVIFPIFFQPKLYTLIEIGSLEIDQLISTLEKDEIFGDNPQRHFKEGVFYLLLFYSLF